MKNAFICFFSLMMALLSAQVKADDFNKSWISFSFTQPTGTAKSNESIDIYVTVALSSAATAPLIQNSSLSLNGIPESLTPKVGGFYNYDSGVYENNVPFVSYTDAYFNFSYICTGSSFTDGNCSGPDTTYQFTFASSQWLDKDGVFEINPGESKTYLLGSFTPKGGLVPVGTYSLAGAYFTVSAYGLDENGNFLFSNIDVARTPTKFTRTITAVPEPQVYALVLSGLIIVGAAATRRRIMN